MVKLIDKKDKRFWDYNLNPITGWRGQKDSQRKSSFGLLNAKDIRTKLNGFKSMIV